MYLILPCLTLSSIKYVSRVNWSNQGKGVAPSSTPHCSSYLKGKCSNRRCSCYIISSRGGACGVMVIVAGNGHDDTSSNPGRDWLHFHIALIPLGKVWIQLFSFQLWVNSRQTRFFSLGEATSLGEGKLWIQTC